MINAEAISDIVANVRAVKGEKFAATALIFANIASLHALVCHAWEGRNSPVHDYMHLALESIAGAVIDVAGLTNDDAEEILNIVKTLEAQAHT